MYVRTHTYIRCKHANAYAMCFLVRDNAARFNFQRRRSPPPNRYEQTPVFVSTFSPVPPTDKTKDSKPRKGALSRSRTNRGGEATEAKK